MRCPYCGSTESRVTDSRETDDGIRRRRECSHCGARFTTYERVQSATLMVAKRDNRREEFNRDKLLHSVRIACAKRPLPTGALEKAVGEIETELQQSGRAEVPAALIGEMVTSRLRELDRVAYIRYASVYRDFDDLEEFTTAIETLQGSQIDGQQEASAGQLRLLPEEPAAQRRPRRGRRPRMTLPVDASRTKQETEEASTKE
ncbi:MAG: transcriptional regulator NrdR [Chloroflexi bacterium]|nr:transcriptional regulator NrdR [Chloroflexota bacterium]